jgi:hypothetical protein
MRLAAMIVPSTFLPPIRMKSSVAAPCVWYTFPA